MTLLELIVAPAVAISAAVGFAKWLDWKIQMRHVSNRFLAAADEEFFSAANKMLKTPDDIPESVLDLIQMMSVTGFSRGSEKSFLRALQETRKDHGETDQALVRDLAGMRPQLRELLATAVAAWFNIMTHKSSRYHRLIAVEASRSKLDGTRRPMSDAEVGIPVAAHMLPDGCIA